MDRIGVLTLIGRTTGKDKYGIDSVTETRTDVYCTLASVSTQEMLSASQMGVSASLRADIYSDEYDGQKIAEYDGKRYRIYRTYQSRKYQDRTELYLEERAGDVATE